MNTTQQNNEYLDGVFQPNENQKVLWIDRLYPASLEVVQSYLNDGWVVTDISSMKFPNIDGTEESFGAYCILTKN